MIGMIHVALHDVDQALIEFEKAIRLDPDDPLTYPEDAQNLKELVHGIHAADDRDRPFQFVRGPTRQGYYDWSEVTFPRGASTANCALCHDDGTYRCVCCGLELFVSGSKFDAGCGWPSFFRPAEDENVVEVPDHSHGMVRTEVTCQPFDLGDDHAERSDVVDDLFDDAARHALAALGQDDQAFAWLEKAYEARDPALVWANVDPGFDNLRPDPRFRDLLRRMNLAE